MGRLWNKCLLISFFLHCMSLVRVVGWKLRFIINFKTNFVARTRLKNFPQERSFWFCLVNQKLLKTYLFIYEQNYINASILCSPTKFKKSLFFLVLYEHICYGLVAKNVNFAL